MCLEPITLHVVLLISNFYFIPSNLECVWNTHKSRRKLKLHIDDSKNGRKRARTSNKGPKTEHRSQLIIRGKHIIWFYHNDKGNPNNFKTLKQTIGESMAYLRVRGESWDWERWRAADGSWDWNYREDEKRREGRAFTGRENESHVCVLLCFI